MNAINFSVRVKGNLGLVPSMSWYGAKSDKLCREFLALTHQETAKLMSQSITSITLSSISDNTTLCFSTRLLLQGDFAAVVFTVIPRISHISMKSLLVNSPPKPDKNLSADPYTDIQILNTSWMMVSGFLLEMTDGVKRWGKWPIK